MIYYILFGFLLSILLFGFRRTVFFTVFFFVSAAVLLLFGTAVMTLMPILAGIYIFYMLFGRKYYRKKYQEQSEKFEKTFRFYYYDMGGGQYRDDNRQKYNDFVNGYDGRKYYSVLGVGENASEDEVKAAYKKLAKQYHPDLHNGKSEEEKKVYENKFKEINEAYDVIKKRQL